MGAAGCHARSTHRLAREAIRFGFAAALAAALMVGVATIRGQEAPPPIIEIAYGQTVTGAFTPADAARLYAFDARPGDLITITLDAPDGGFDPFLILLDEPMRHVLAVDDDSGGGGNARLRYVVRHEGRHIIRATAVRGEVRGAFVLSLILNNPSPTPTPAAVTDAAAIVLGQPAQGTITNPRHRIHYVLETQAGTTLRIAMDAASGSTLDPLIHILDSTGVVLATNDDRAIGIQNAALTFHAPRSGQYYVVATRAGEARGESAGGFTLLVERMQASPATSTPQGRPAIIPIRYGSLVAGTINEASPLVFYGFQGEAGDVITVRMTPQEGSALIPALYLYDYADGSVAPSYVASAESVPGAAFVELASLSLPVSGAYVIVATRQGAVQGQSQGAFELMLVGNAAGHP